MVDYKNAERIRHLFTQLTSAELQYAYRTLRSQLPEEHRLRQRQRFDISLEPTTDWNPVVARLLHEILSGNPHPQFFGSCQGHALDPLLPVGFHGEIPAFAYYDVWCQLMVRALVAVRGTYDLEDLTRIESPQLLSLSGKLISFKGSMRGRVALPGEYQTHPVSKVKLHVRTKYGVWRSILDLRTHYVYSVTATMPLGRGMENGLLLMRSVDRVLKAKHRHEVEFSCTPLIIGNGALEIPKDNTDS